MSTTPGIDAILNEREKTHGAYEVHARITQRLKAVVTEAVAYRKSTNKSELTASMLETLDMTCHKMGRILAGDPSEPDHWRDIAGYNELVVREIVRDPRAS